MSVPAIHLQRRRAHPTVNECVTNNGQTYKNSTYLPETRRQIQPDSTKNTDRNALGAGDRWFKSGHPDCLTHCGGKSSFPPFLPANTINSAL